MNEKVSKYLLIENYILQNIEKGKYKPGDKIDSESILKKKFNVSTITVRKAFNDLINSGYLYGIQGVGTFVAKKNIVRGLTSISFAEELRQQGYSTKLEVIGINKVSNPTIAKVLGLENDKNLLCVERVRYANNTAVAYHISYCACLSLQQASDVYKSNSFYSVLKKYNHEIDWVQETYSVEVLNDKKICNKLKLKIGDPTFFTKRVAYDELDNAIEYCETYFVKDWYSVTVTIDSKKR